MRSFAAVPILGAAFRLSVHFSRYIQIFKLLFYTKETDILKRLWYTFNKDIPSCPYTLPKGRNEVIV